MELDLGLKKLEEFIKPIENTKTLESQIWKIEAGIKLTKTSFQKLLGISEHLENVTD